MKKLILSLALALTIIPAFIIIYNQDDILFDQETIEGSIINTGVVDDNGRFIKVNYLTNRIVKGE